MADGYEYTGLMLDLQRLYCLHTPLIARVRLTCRGLFCIIPVTSWFSLDCKTSIMEYDYCRWPNHTSTSVVDAWSDASYFLICWGSPKLLAWHSLQYVNRMSHMAFVSGTLCISKSLLQGNCIHPQMSGLKVQDTVSKLSTYSLFLTMSPAPSLRHILLYLTTCVKWFSFFSWRCWVH